MRKFVARKRPTPDELAHRYGLDGTMLAQLCEYSDDKLTNTNKIIEFFLQARSSYEKNAIIYLAPQIELELEKKIVFRGYEWQSFSLPGGGYTPDWSFLLEDSTWVHVEIKASKLQPNYRDARSKVRAAASLNPWAIFFEFRKRTVAEGGGWLLERIKPDPQWIENLKIAFEQWKGETFPE